MVNQNSAGSLLFPWVHWHIWKRNWTVPRFNGVVDREDPDWIGCKSIYHLQIILVSCMEDYNLSFNSGSDSCRAPAVEEGLQTSWPSGESGITDKRLTFEPWLRYLGFQASSWTQRSSFLSQICSLFFNTWNSLSVFSCGFSSETDILLFLTWVFFVIVVSKAVI